MVPIYRPGAACTDQNQRFDFVHQKSACRMNNRMNLQGRCCVFQPFDKGQHDKRYEDTIARQSSPQN
jgi:hypothetical protein